MISALALSIAMSATSVPPGWEVENHAHPAHYGQPTVQLFERKPVDDYRRNNWVAYNLQLERSWQAYRAAGSTRAAWHIYLAEATAAKRQYVIDDPYLLPIIEAPATYLPPWKQVWSEGDGAGCCRQ